MLLKPDMVQNPRHQRIAGIGRHGVDMVFESDVEFALDLVEVDVGMGGLPKVLKEGVDRARYELPGNHTCCEDHKCDNPSYDLHGVGLEGRVLRRQVVEPGSSAGTKRWLGGCRVVDGRGVVAMCVSILRRRCA